MLYTILISLAGDIGFEPMMTISKTVALGQARRIPNKILIANTILKFTKLLRLQ